MPSVDTDVVLRFLLADDAAQHERAAALVAADEVVVPIAVVLGVEWVLRSFYGHWAEQVAGALTPWQKPPGSSWSRRAGRGSP